MQQQSPSSSRTRNDVQEMCTPWVPRGGHAVHTLQHHANSSGRVAVHAVGADGMDSSRGRTAGRPFVEGCAPPLSRLEACVTRRSWTGHSRGCCACAASAVNAAHTLKGRAQPAAAGSPTDLSNQVTLYASSLAPLKSSTPKVPNREHTESSNSSCQCNKARPHPAPSQTQTFLMFTDYV